VQHIEECHGSQLCLIFGLSAATPVAIHSAGKLAMMLNGHLQSSHYYDFRLRTVTHQRAMGNEWAETGVTTKPAQPASSGPPAAKEYAVGAVGRNNQLSAW
jgi:hypothetical protein